MADQDNSATSGAKIYLYDPDSLSGLKETTLETGTVLYVLKDFTPPSNNKGYLLVLGDQITGSAVSIDGLPADPYSGGKTILLVKSASDYAYVATMFFNSTDFYSSANWQALAFLSAGYAGTISLKLTTADQETACKAVNSDWEALKDDVRSLSIPKPGSVSGQSANENWEVTTSVTFAGMWAGLRDACNAIATTIDNWVHSAVGGNSDAEATVFAIRQQTLKPTTTGEDRIGDIIRRAYLLNQNLTNLIANDTNCGTFGVKFRKFKWNSSAESDTNVYSSLRDLQNDIAALVEVAKRYYADFQEPVQTAGEYDEKVCGKFPVNIGLKTFSWMFCELGAMLHRVAVYLLEKSLKWLTDIIGINVNMSFTAPQIKEETTTGGGGTGGGGTGGGGTGGGGGSTGSGGGGGTTGTPSQ